MIVYNIKVGKFVYRKGLTFEEAERIKFNLSGCVNNLELTADREVQHADNS